MTNTEKDFSEFLILSRSDEEIPFDWVSLLDSEDGSGLEELFDLEASNLQLDEEQASAGNAELEEQA